MYWVCVTWPHRFPPIYCHPRNTFLVEFLIVLDHLALRLTFFFSLPPFFDCVPENETRRVFCYLFYLFNSVLVMLRCIVQIARRLAGSHVARRDRFWSVSRSDRGHTYPCERVKTLLTEACGVLQLFCMHFARVAAPCQDTARFEFSETACVHVRVCTYVRVPSPSVVDLEIERNQR